MFPRLSVGSVSFILTRDLCPADLCYCLVRIIIIKKKNKVIKYGNSKNKFNKISALKFSSLRLINPFKNFNYNANAITVTINVQFERARLKTFIFNNYILNKYLYV